jgi:PAS domain S-box-containing protein
MTFVNEAFAHMVGYEVDEVVGMNFTQLVAPEDLEELVDNYYRRQAGEEVPEQYEWRMLHKDGRRVYVSMSVGLIEVNGRVASMGTVKDVTEQKEAQETLRINEERLSLVLESGRLGIWEFWPFKEQVYFNPTWYTMLGYEAYEFPQSYETWAGLLHPEDAERAEKAVQGAIRGGQDFAMQFRMRTKGGDWRWIQANGYVTELTPEGMGGRLIGTHADVTERKRAEEALRASEDKFRSVIEQSHDGILIFDREGKVVEWNEALAGITGIPRQEALHKPFWELESELVPPYENEGPSQVKSPPDIQYMYFDPEGSSWLDQLQEFEVLRPDGVVRIVQAVTFIMQREEGPMLGAIVRDVTEQYRIAEALEESERRYRTIFETTSSAMLVLNEDMTIALANEEFAKLSGYSKEEIEGHMKWSNFVTEEDLERMTYYHYLRRRDPDASPRNYEFQLVDRYGNLKDIYITVGMIPDTDRSVASFLDITEWNRAKEALQASEERFRSLVESANDFIALQDPTTGEYLFAHVPESFGVTPDQVVGCLPHDLLPEKAADDLMDHLHRVVRSREAVTIERELDWQGRHLYFSTTLSPIIQEAEVVAVMALTRDITQQKLVEQEMVRTERLALTGKLAASVAHEINNPLQGVLGCMGLAKEALAQGQEIEEYLDIARDEVKRIAQIITRFGDLYRPEVAEAVPVEPNVLVEEVLELTRKQFIDQEIELIWRPASELPRLNVVPGRIKQVFLNLILNAIAAMPSGGRMEVATRATMKPAGIEVRFTDTGVGIPQESLPHIFKPFYSTRNQGTGLGLTISADIVAQHHGEIDVISREGEGSTFTVWLPLGDEDAESSRTEGGG